MARDPLSRFSDRVEHYVRHRPGYPDAVIDTLVDRDFLFPGAVVADVGSGTGLLSRPFLARGHPVIGVEPNAAMRAAGERALSEFPEFVSVDGSAEATGLAPNAVDLVVAGQAFHWFDVPGARDEFRRILRPRGAVALIWNSRRRDGGFHTAYEALIARHGTDYSAVNHDDLGAGVFAAFFGHPDWEERKLRNSQRLDHDGLRGRLLSCSYAPAEGEPGHREMLDDLAAVFDEHQEEGFVTLRYDTQLYLGRLR